MSPFSRIQWSKLGITIYDGCGGFVSRIEHNHDVAFFNQCAVEALRRISAEQLRRRTYKSEDKDATTFTGAEAVDVGEQAGNGEEVGSGDAGRAQPAREGSLETKTGEPQGEKVTREILYPDEAGTLDRELIEHAVSVARNNRA